MLTASFFVAVFLTSSWITYIATYIHSRLSGVAFADLGLTDISLYSLIAFFPVFIIWTVWGYFYQFLQSRDWAKQSQLMLRQAKNNQEFLEVMAKLLLQMGQTSHDDFVVGKIDLFISEMNESIFDILQKNNLMTPENLSKVWNMADKGNRWGFAKALVNLKNQDRRFEGSLAKAAQSNLVIKASMAEFCARYKRLCEILKKHDTNELFLDVIQTGAFARVNYIFETVLGLLTNVFEEVEMPEVSVKIDIPQALSEEEVSLEALLGEPLEDEQPKIFFEPADEDEIFEELIAVEQVVEIAQIEIKEEPAAKIIVEQTGEKKEEEGFFSKMGGEPVKQQMPPKPQKKTLNIKISNIFKRKSEPEEEPWQARSAHHIDPLTLALERSFGKLADEKKVDTNKEPTNDKFAFLSTDNTLKDLQKEWEELKSSEMEKKSNEADKV